MATTWSQWEEKEKSIKLNPLQGPPQISNINNHTFAVLRAFAWFCIEGSKT